MWWDLRQDVEERFSSTRVFSGSSQGLKGTMCVQSISARASLTLRYKIWLAIALMGTSFQICTVEYLQGTVVGVQGQQMLVCAQDLACLLRSLRSSPQEPSIQKRRSSPRVLLE